MTVALALIADNPDALANYRDPDVSVIHACEQATWWLTAAVARGAALDEVVAVKADASVIAEYTKQKQLGKDAQLAATEVVRRAERCIGVAIRAGQAEGTIRRHAGRPPKIPAGSRNLNVSPTDYATDSELSGNGAGIYCITDGVSDEQFEAAIAAAKAEGNLARANVVRKISNPPTSNPRRTSEAKAARLERIRELADEGHNGDQIAEELDMRPGYVRELARRAQIVIHADTVTPKSHKPNAEKMIGQLTLELDGLAATVEFIDLSALSADVLQWADSLSASISTLRRFLSRLKKESTHHAQD